VHLLVIKVKNKGIFFKRKLECLTNCQGLLVRSSKTVSKKAVAPSHSVLPCYCRSRSPYSCHVTVAAEAHTVAMLLSQQKPIQLPCYCRSRSPYSCRVTVAAEAHTVAMLLSQQKPIQLPCYCRSRSPYSCRVNVAAEAHTVAETLLQQSAAEIRLGNNRKRNLTTVDLAINSHTSHSSFVSKYRKKSYVYWTVHHLES